MNDSGDAPADGAHAPLPPRMLMVATVSATIAGFLTPFARHLRSRGWVVDAAANGATTDDSLEGEFDTLLELPLSRSVMDVRGAWAGYRAIGAVLERSYDVVHVHTPIASFVTRAAVRRRPAATRPAVVYTAHGFHFHVGGSRTSNAIFLTAEKVAGRWTDRLVVINHEDHEAAKRHHLVPGARLVYMPGIGVDCDWYSRDAVSAAQMADVRAAAGIGATDPVFTVVGELSIRKRPFDVVAALGRMRHRDAHLLLCGDGAERPRVERAMDEAGVRDRVHLLGPVSDVRPAVATAVGLVLASSREGLPRSIMEALALEVPVVTTTARGNPDLVEPDAGIVVGIGDVEGLASAMDSLLDDGDAARAMGSAGRTRMVEQYSLPRLIEAHDHLYAELLQQRARPSG